MACLVYAACAAPLTLLPRHQGVVQVVHTGKEVIVEMTRKEALGDPLPPPVNRIAVPSSTLKSTVGPPILLTNAVPETPAELPTKDVSTVNFGNVETGSKDGSLQPEGTQTPNFQGRVDTHAPRVYEVAFNNVKILHQVQPTYPTLCRVARIQGMVVLLMTIDPHGLPSEVRVVSGRHPSLDAEAVRAAKLWKFEPAHMNGQPVFAQFHLTLNFQLN
jgi:TonB family protein